MQSRSPVVGPEAEVDRLRQRPVELVAQQIGVGAEPVLAIRLKHLEQVASDARQHFSNLAEKYSQAELARGEQQLADVRLAAPAVPPREPLSL